MDSTVIPNPETAAPQFLSGGGEMGSLIRSKDWSKTPLGSPGTWPQSLRTSVSVCIASNFPIAIAWGPQRVQIYNDGYWPITGDMHPTSMGQDFKECWISAWPVIGQAFEEAFLGETRFLENQRIFLERHGYTEETFFTFSFSPILDETGGVGGLFHPVIEQTQQTLAERRLNILPAVANHTVNARTAEEASALILECLKDFELDLPFVLLYSIAADGKEAYLEGSVGVEKDSPLAPAKINLQDHALKSWPFIEVIQNGKAVQVEELAEIFGPFNCGPYPEPPEQALVFPVILPGAAHNNYFLVAGVSSRRSLDEKYLLFYKLLTASITNTLTKARAYEQERKKAEALAEIDRAKTIFFSNISHEFRTPLTLMLSPLEELLNQKKNNFSESEKQNIETTHRNSMRLLKLVNTLLDFSRIESGRQQAIFSLVDIVALTKSLASNFRSVIEKAGLKLIVKADTIIQPVYVDRQMWEKIVFNLLSNAFKYTLKGSITVELTPEKDFAVLKIKDTGVGIPEKELPKMFERFHRVQNVTGRTYEGAGIGLSLIKELVQMHHGTIGIDSKINEGSVFTVKIPFGKEHLNGHHISTTEMDADVITSNIYVDEVETLLESDKKQKSKSLSSKEKSALPTVLIVDDNADMREHISSVLSNHFNVLTANNGMDALHKMQEIIPSLVLSDIMMPVMDGIDLLKEIKNNKATANIPVIFLTARAGEESKIEGWETGADDYLVKPFSAKELVARVRAQIKIVKLRNELESNVRNLFLEAPAIICVLRGPQHVYELANAMYLQLIGNRDIVGKPIRKALPELEGTGIYELLDHVYLTGEPFIGNELPVKLDRGNGKLEETYFNFVYQPSHNSEGVINGILVHGVDVTDQVLARKKIEESEKQFKNVLLQSPSIFVILEGFPEMIITFANESLFKSWGRTAAIIGKPLLEALPEIKDQPFPKLLQRVFETGEPYYSTEEKAVIIKNGVSVDTYYIYVYQPICDDASTNVQERKVTGVRIMATDITEQVKSRIKVEEQNKVLEMISGSATLSDALDFLMRSIELQSVHGMKASILLLDEEGKHLWHGAAPSLHEAYNNAIDGIAVGPNSGSCGTAAFTKKPVIVSDISTDPLWKDFKDLALTHHLRSCWSTPIFSSGGKLLGTFAIYYDKPHEATEDDKQIIAFATTTAALVIERKRNEEKIKESEQRFRNLADDSPLFVFIIDPDPLAPVSYWNKTLLQYTGQAIEEAVGRAWNGIIHPDDIPIVMNFYVPAFQNRQPYFIPAVRTKRHDGEYRWHAYKGNPRYLANGDFNGYVGVGFDVHEQKLAEEALKESEERFRTLANNIQNLAWIANGDGWIYWYNQRWYDYTGATLEEMQGWGWEKVHHHDHIKRVVDFVKEAWKKNEPFELTFPLRNKDGEYRWFLTRANPITNANGEIIRWIGTNTDIEDQKTVEEKLEKLVAERTNELQRSNDDLQQFAHVASHDLKEPVRKIRIFGSRLSQEFGKDLPEKAKTYVAKMESAAERMYAMIDGVLMYSSLSVVDQKAEAVDLNNVFHHIESDLELIIQQKNSAIQYRGLPTVEGSSILLYQLFYNLINNSLKFSKPNTNPLVKINSEIVNVTDLREYGITGDEKNYIKLSVKDNGIGFSTSEADKIFKTFSRLHPKDEYEGTGLGLALCKKIVERHGGAISAKGVESEGAIFEIILPIKQPHKLI